MVFFSLFSINYSLRVSYYLLLGVSRSTIYTLLHYIGIVILLAKQQSVGSSLRSGSLPVEVRFSIYRYIVIAHVCSSSVQ